MHHRGAQDTARLSVQDPDGQFEHGAAVGGAAEKIRVFFLGIVEAISSIFALFDEVFCRTGFGRRYFSVLGIAATYYLTIGIYYVGSLVLYLRNNAASLKPSLVIDPMGLQQTATGEVASAPSASPGTMFLVLQLFIVVALVQKMLTLWRKIMHKEPALSVYGGESIFSWLLVYVPEWWIKHFAVNKEDFVKRYVEPVCCYAIGGWVITPLVDPLTGSLVQWSAIAMFVRAYCIRLRFQMDLDNTSDSQEKVRHLFDKLDDKRGGHEGPIRISVN